MTELPCDLRDTSAETIARLRAMHLFSATDDDQRNKKMKVDFTRLGMDNLRDRSFKP